MDNKEMEKNEHMKDGSRISPHEYYQAVHSVKVGIEEQDD